MADTQGAPAGEKNEKKELTLAMKGVMAPVPWQAVLLPVTEFPLKKPQYGVAKHFFMLLGQVLERDYGLKREVLLQMWKLAPDTGAGLLSKNGTLWKPQLGLGMWPDREPPTGWSQTAMMDGAAAVFRGDEPAKPYYKLFRLTGEAAARADAALAMSGLGVTIQAFTKLESAMLLERSQKIFLPRVKDDRFKKEGFYLPLLDCNSVNSAAAVEQMDACLCGIDVYIRESAEDMGILILSRIPLAPLLEKVKELSRQG